MIFKASSKKMGYLIDKYMEEIHEEGIEKFRLKLEKNPSIAEEIRRGLYETEKRANPFTILIYHVEPPSFKIVKRENLEEENKVIFKKVIKDNNKVKIIKKYNLFNKK